MLAETVFAAFAAVMAVMTLIWILSVIKKNASLVDVFWGSGMVLTGAVYYLLSHHGFWLRRILVLSLLIIWGIRLSLYVLVRNWGRGEDPRYRDFRIKYGVRRYWWVSYFQVFLLQGILLILVSLPLLGAMAGSGRDNLNVFDLAGILLWFAGFLFEAAADFQLAVFRARAKNRGRVLNSGVWGYTRHPNYFGETLIWWGYGCFSIGAGMVLPFFGSLLMTILLLKVSGVALLEKKLQKAKPAYREYILSTPAFFPRLRKK